MFHGQHLQFFQDTVGGWQGMVWQVIILALTSLLYWPFAKAYDNILLKEEAETEAEINAAE